MPLTPEQLKALFRQLVQAAGGVVPAGSVLEVSHQRVSQLQTLGNDLLPSVMHIVALEAFVGQPVVTGFLAKLCSDAGESADPVKEAADVAVAAGKVVQLVSQHAPPQDIAAAVTLLKDEADDVTLAVRPGSG